jgi:hypothetical protein
VRDKHIACTSRECWGGQAFRDWSSRVQLSSIFLADPHRREGSHDPSWASLHQYARLRLLRGGALQAGRPVHTNKKRVCLDFLRQLGRRDRGSIPVDNGLGQTHLDRKSKRSSLYGLGLWAAFSRCMTFGDRAQRGRCLKLNLPDTTSS